MDAINWGILGAAKFAREHMGPAIHAARGARLAALATSSPDKADPFRAFCPDLRVHDGYAALLADPQVDAVYIPLPNHMHVEWATKALKAGKHVLVEKPVALRADEVDPLIALRDQTGLQCAEAYMIVHHPQWQRVRALLAEGAVGRLRRVDGAFSFDNRDMGNIRNRPETGGGSLPDIGVYTMGSARWATGAEPAEISAWIEWENGVDVFAQVNAEMAGAAGRFSYSAMTSTRMAPRQEMTFHGDQGVLRVLVPFNPTVFGPAELRLSRPGEAERVERFPGINQYVNQVEAFGRAIGGAAPFPWRLEDARGTQAMIDRVFAAAGPRPGA